MSNKTIRWKIKSLTSRLNKVKKILQHTRKIKKHWKEESKNSLLWLMIL